jgi:UDPglucose--hexose-1-phosphate uridylyltransferase
MNLQNTSHRRKNILTGEWTLVSPHRLARPWDGKKDKPLTNSKLSYDPNCYLCPGNERNNGKKNPLYKDVYVFNNDFSALKNEPIQVYQDGLFEAKSESGICRVICYSDNHKATLPILNVNSIEKIIKVWQNEYQLLGEKSNINYVQIFENKGLIMGCSNPHPHGQIWAQESIPTEAKKKDIQQKRYWDQNGFSLLGEYLKQELKIEDRVIFKNSSFVALVPFWAIWPFETIIIPKRHVVSILEFTNEEVNDYAQILKELTIRYDNLFETSFPYSAGIHQAPTNGQNNKHWCFHMCFYPPLLRSADIKKFMVGYEMFAEPQRDITPEVAAEYLKKSSEIKYSKI